MKKILAVDGNSIVNRAFYGVRPLSTKEGLPTNALFGMVNILEKNLEAVAPDFCAIAFDLKAPTFRHEMFQDYKAGRKPMPDELRAQMPLAKETARALGFRTLELEGYEADDILGTLAAMAEREECEAYILTGDRDALQLISDRVHVLLATNTDTVEMDTARFFEKYGVNPCQFIDVKALMGDSSDNIPGVPGIGEKTALKLIADFGSLDGIYEALPEAKHTPSVLKNSPRVRIAHTSHSGLPPFAAPCPLKSHSATLPTRARIKKHCLRSLPSLSFTPLSSVFRWMRR